MDYSAKIGLGTVQFGMPYGISNIEGQTNQEEVSKILQFAKKTGITLLDTAAGYGNSEAALGHNNLTNFKVVSKFLPPHKENGIGEQLETSLKKLKKNSLYGYLAHRPMDVLANPEQWDELVLLKSNGFIKKIGFSFNDPLEVETILAKGMIPDLVQVPFNYIDERFNNKLIELKSLGCEVHSRSAFLQGLFFLPADSLPNFFDPIKELLVELQKLEEKLPSSLLRFCLEKDFIDTVIIGVNNVAQLQSNFENIESAQSLPKVKFTIPEYILSPTNWKLNT